METAKTWGVHILAVLVALAFLASGAGKLMGTPELVENFARWGYPSWFIYFTGGLEALAAVFMLVPKTRAYSGAVLAAVMVGAFGTHAMAGEWPEAVPSLVLGGLSVLLAWLHREPLMRFLPGAAQTA